MEELLTNPATFGVFIQLFKLGLDFSKEISNSPWKPNQCDKKMMYVEMITRITQPLTPEHGDYAATDS